MPEETAVAIGVRLLRFPTNSMSNLYSLSSMYAMDRTQRAQYPTTTHETTYSLSTAKTTPCLWKDHQISSRLPPNPPNPPRPLLHILPLNQQFHIIKLLRKHFITLNLMHIRMTSPTQPCDCIQFPLLVPAPLQSFGMCGARDQMVVR